MEEIVNIAREEIRLVCMGMARGEDKEEVRVNADLRREFPNGSMDSAKKTRHNQKPR